MSKNILIKSIRWDITDRCNLKCRHCYTHPLSCPDLPFDDVINILSKISQYGLLEVNFSGREPTLREDMIDIITWCCDHELQVNMTTNGAAIAAPSFQAYLDLPMTMIVFSLDGASSNVHDSIRGSGNFQKTIESLKYCCNYIIKKNIATKIGISFTLQKENIRDCARIVELCWTLGIDLLSVNPVSITGSALKVREQLYIPPTTVLECWNTICRTYQNIKPEFMLYLGTFPMEAKWLNAQYSCDLPVIHTGCSAGKTLYINPCGKALPCYMLPTMIGIIPGLKPLVDYWNVLTETAEHAYHKFTAFIDFAQRHTQKNFIECAECSDIEVCRRCPLIALSDNDALYRCQLARQMLDSLHVQIPSNAVITLKPNVAWCFAGNTLFLNIHAGDYSARKEFELDNYSKQIWYSLVNHNTVAEIEEAVLANSKSQNQLIIKEHCLNFIRYFWRDGILDIIR